MDRVWLTRLRWRLRGAVLWPAFALLTAVDAVLLARLPVYGTGPDGAVPALLLSGALNLVCVAVLAPAGGWLLRRRRPDLPRPVAADVAGTAALLALALGLVVAGAAHRSEVRAERRALAAQASAVARYVHAQEPRYVRGLPYMDTVRLGKDQYRSCVPGPDPDRWLCVIVDTDQDPPGVSRDGDATPNRG
jgi:hypothetical protein